MPLVAQAPVQAVGADLRAREDDGLVGLLGLEHLDELLGLVGALDVELELLDGVDGQRVGLDLHVDRVVEVAVGQRRGSAAASSR
jgi:hypothetical protein